MATGPAAKYLPWSTEDRGYRRETDMTTTYTDDEGSSMTVVIDGDEVSVTYYTDTTKTGQEFVELARWTNDAVYREADGWVVL
jgi:hypothetical protein